MALGEILPTVSQLSHEDKLRLIHFLLLAVVKEEGVAQPAASCIEERHHARINHLPFYTGGRRSNIMSA